MLLPQGAAHKAFEEAARTVDEVEVFQTTSADAAEAAGLSKEGLVVVKTFEGEDITSVFDGSLSDKDAIKTFVKNEKVGCDAGHCTSHSGCLCCCN